MVEPLPTRPARCLLTPSSASAAPNSISGSGGGGGGGGGATAYGGLKKLIYFLLTWQKDYIH